MSMTFHTLREARNRAIEETGVWQVSFGGDYGQDEGRGETGMGNHKYSIIVYPNGTAILTIEDVGTPEEYGIMAGA